MKKNMGGTDKIVRIIIALIIVALFFTKIISGVLGIVLIIVAGVFVLTSLISFCPLYNLVGLNTCTKDEK
jgi:hypothetical protein